jgi:hypothetical protein
MKTCSKCKTEKSIKDFHKNKSRKDGLAHECRECVSYNDKIIYQNNREKIKQSRLNNRAKISAYVKNRKHTDIHFKLACGLRNRLWSAIKNNQKVGSAVRDLGCSISELKTYLESKFQEGMDWANHGEWEVDHIKPLSKFDLTNRNQFLEACHYSNLQPLWFEANRIKGNK